MAVRRPLVRIGGKNTQLPAGDTLSPADVGLGSADNTSDADKPVSTAQQAALDGKQDALVSGVNLKTINGASLLGGGNIELATAAQVGEIASALDAINGTA